MAEKSKTREEMIRDFLEAEREKDAAAAAAASSRDKTVRSEGEPVRQESAPKALPLPSEEANLPEGEVLIAWEGPEFETFERDKKWYLVASVILLLIIIYAAIVNSPIMAITFILIGTVGYVYLQKEPRHLTFAVTPEGILVGDEIYYFEDIDSFWIFYEPPHTYLLSLDTKNRLTPHVHIPLHQVDPVQLRAVLLEFIPEVRQEMSLVDTLERLLHI